MSYHLRAGLLVLAAMVALGFGLTLPAGAGRADAPLAQAPTPFLTPTPNANGEIIYTVAEGDTAWRIAAIAGITLEELYALNGLQPTDFITPGLQLLLGTGGPPAPTAPPEGAAPPTEIPVTPTPSSGTGDICVLLFVDQNGDARMATTELPLANGQVSVADASGMLVGEHTTTDAIEGHCFTELENGDYNVSAAVPEDFNPTTALNLPVRLAPGEIKFVEFGAQPSAAIGGGIEGGGGTRSTLLGILGVVLLFAAGGLGYYASRYSRRRSPMSLR